MKTLRFYFFTSILLFSNFSCNKKEKSIEQLEEEKNKEEIYRIYKEPDTSASKTIKAVLALINLDRVSRAASIISGLSKNNKNKGKKVLKNLLPQIFELLKNKQKGHLAKDFLLGIFPFLSTDSQKTSAGKISNWYNQNFITRVKKGDFKIKKTLEIIWNHLGTNPRNKLAENHAKWLIDDFSNRRDEIRVIYRRSIIRRKIPTRKNKIYKAYFKLFKNHLVNNIIKNYNTTLPKSVQKEQFELIKKYGSEKDKINAGKKILTSLKKSGRGNLESIRALGTFNTPGASEYLKKFIRPNVKQEVRKAVHKALAQLTDDPLSCTLLYKDFKTLLIALKTKNFESENIVQKANYTIEGLSVPRKCKLPKDNFNLVKKVFTMNLENNLYKLRKSIMIPLYRLLIYSGGKKGLVFLLNNISLPMSYKKLQGIVRSFSSLDQQNLLEVLRRRVKSDKLKDLLPAIWGLSVNGEVTDISTLQKFAMDKRVIPKWNQTLGEFSKKGLKTLESNIKK
ncbi:MAG: hypothetical protein ACQES9_04890 [Myxococcota bacterium]